MGNFIFYFIFLLNVTKTIALHFLKIQNCRHKYFCKGLWTMKILSFSRDLINSYKTEGNKLFLSQQSLLPIHNRCIFTNQFIISFITHTLQPFKLQSGNRHSAAYNTGNYITKLHFTVWKPWPSIIQLVQGNLIFSYTS